MNFIMDFLKIIAALILITMFVIAISSIIIGYKQTTNHKGYTHELLKSDI